MNGYKVRVLIFGLLLGLLANPAFSEIVSWKGMEHGLDARPKWFFKYVKSGKEKPIKKRFELDSESGLILGIGKGGDLETARTASQMEVQKKAAVQSQIIVSLTPLYEYWEEDDEEGYAVYSLYEKKCI